MKSTDDQGLIPVIVASEADTTYIRTIPTAQAATGDGSVSLDLGLPPECATSVAAGGKRPEMKDMNGIWNLFSRAIQSLQAYRGVYDATFATSIGGYPEYAMVSDSSGSFWVSTADSNTTTPGATDGSWKSLFDGLATSSDLSTETTRAKAAEATISENLTTYVSGQYGAVSENGDNYGVGLHQNGSTSRASFIYDVGSTPESFDLASYSDLCRMPDNHLSSGSLTVSAGVTYLKIKIIGGGGAGCSCEGEGLSTSSYGAGGAAGGYVYFYLPVTKGDVVAWTVGTGGGSPTGTTGSQSNGGDTYVTLNGTEVARAKGGAGGSWISASSSAGGIGGSISTEGAAISFEWSNGTDGGDGQTGYESISSVSGYGGPGPWGGGGRAGNGGGEAGEGFGAGGGGAYDTSYSGTFYKGGAGYQGCVIVEQV